MVVSTERTVGTYFSTGDDEWDQASSCEYCDVNRYPNYIRASISVECRSFKTSCLDILSSFLQQVSCDSFLTCFVPRPPLSPCPLVGIRERNVFVCVFMCVQQQQRTPAGSSFFRLLRNETIEEVKTTNGWNTSCPLRILLTSDMD